MWRVLEAIENVATCAVVFLMAALLAFVAFTLACAALDVAGLI